jgi:uncharacterized protein YhfF
MADIERFWARFVEATGIDGPHTAWGFGSSPEMMTELGLLVRDGPKRATASLRSGYDEGEPMPRAGDLGVILAGAGRPVCVVRTTAVEVRAFGAVDAELAWTEGEGDRSLEFRRDAHIRFFAADGTAVDERTPVVLERFELLWAGGE